ncbi:MAG TPA: alpha/beta hydrolase [Phenylobacterium sp.]|nr:alpha/beta hydrolase [Phenylobacterium sp.]
MRLKSLAAALMLVFAAPAAVAETPKLLTFHDIQDLARGLAGQHIAYGDDPLQFGELWTPKGRGPHPLIVMIHGGCWRADLPGLDLQSPLSAALAQHGWAVWNIEYRRIGHGGGAYPGTFQDVARGVDAVRGFAKAQHIDLNRVVFMGHSAGGQLAAWAAGRARLPQSSPLWVKDPLPANTVVSLAGINDLEAYHDKGPDACGGPGVVEDLVDFKGRGADAYADTSPRRLLPLDRGQFVISGELDPIVPPDFGEAYGSAALKSGDAVQVMTLTGAGHFELIDPRSAAWATLFPLIDALGGLPAKAKP